MTTVSSTSLQVSWEAPENEGPPITDYDYRYREASESNWTQVTNSTITGTTVTIDMLRPGTFYDVEVRAKNDEGVSDWSIAGFETTAAPGANNPPVFREGASATRSVSASEPAGTNIGDPFTATDVDTDDTLTYSLEGTGCSVVRHQHDKRPASHEVRRYTGSRQHVHGYRGRQRRNGRREDYGHDQCYRHAAEQPAGIRGRHENDSERAG